MVEMNGQLETLPNLGNLGLQETVSKRLIVKVSQEYPQTHLSMLWPHLLVMVVKS